LGAGGLPSGFMENGGIIKDQDGLIGVFIVLNLYNNKGIIEYFLLL